MADWQASWQKFIKDARRVLYVLRNDPATLAKVRTTGLASLVGLTLCWAAYSLTVEPLAKRVRLLRDEYTALEHAAPVAMADTLASALASLAQATRAVDEQTTALLAREEQLRASRLAAGAEERFARVLLGLVPGFGDSAANGMDRVRWLDEVKREGFTIQPVIMEGEATYAELLSYLRHLEGQPEVSILDQLAVALPKDAAGNEDRIAFAIRLGRVRLEETP